MDIAKYNRKAWDSQVRAGNRWTRPVSPEVIAHARQGDWKIIVTPQRPVPRSWFGDIDGKRLLCLAGGGGQQGPILAAAGAVVTVFDNSPGQLAQDRAVAEREALEIATVQGDMRDLSMFPDNSFDLIVHPCSNTFVPDVNMVWREAFRVLRTGGRLIAGFVNPLFYLFDYWEMEKGKLDVRYSVPYSDTEQLDQTRLQQLLDDEEPLTFGHSLDDQIGGQLRAGFRLTGFFEDDWDDPPANLLSSYIRPLIGTLSEKPRTREPAPDQPAAAPGA